MVYTSNARGQAEKTYFIDDDDSTTRTTTRYYTWRDKVRRVTHPDTNSLDYEYNDYLQLTKEKLQGNDEYYEFEWCLCGALKRHRYHYIDSQDDAQDMDWTLTTDKLGRVEKEYYPYAIAKHGGDEYRSLLFEYDTASRRTAFSDPTFGHTCPETSGWSGHVEPDDEDNWAFDEPLRYLFAAEGNLRALGRVKGSGIREGEGEPYFVKRDGAGRVASVIYPNKASTQKPEYEMRYEYAADGRVAQTALVRMWEADTAEYGPERFVVQYIYDKGGRLVRKVVRDNSVQDSAVRYETSYEFDGMGRMTRERVLKRVEESGVERMNVLEDKRTTYDLGNNPTEVKFYDNAGWAYTETRSYARGYQLVDFSTQAALGVSVSTSGSYTYDTNNNLSGTKKLDVKRGATQLAYRAQWTFTYDRKNRLKSHTNTNASNVRGNLWYDGRGRVWQRWNDNSATEDWDATLKRFVYDGGALVQEHEFDVAEVEDEWVYTYSDLTRDYLRHAAGVRQRERSGGNDTDYYLEADSGALEFKTERNPVAEAIARTERTASLNQISGATFTPGLSNLATSGNYIEMYGGGTSGSSGGFDALIHRESRHFLAGLGRFASRQGNNTYELRGVEAPWPSARPAGETSIPEKLTDLNEECGIRCLMWAADRVENCDPLASAATGNLLHDFCCVPWICLATYHILPEEEENDCFECLCLVGNPADEDTPRGCLCKRLLLLNENTLGWAEYVRRALIARDECNRAQQAILPCNYEGCGYVDFCVDWCALVNEPGNCADACFPIVIPDDLCPLITCVTPNICCYRDQFQDWYDNPNCMLIGAILPKDPPGVDIWAENCCMCLVMQIARRAMTYCANKVEC